MKKSKSNTAKMKELFFEIMIPCFDTYMNVILTVSSKKESNYAGVSFY